MHSNPFSEPGYEASYLNLVLHDESERSVLFKQKLDEFLDVLSLYRKVPLPIIREELVQKVYELNALDPDFKFQL